MMSVTDKSANIEFTEYEYEVLGCLTSARIESMKSNMNNVNKHKYIEMCQLNAKIESVLTMINHEKKRKENEDLEDIEDCTHRVG